MKKKKNRKETDAERIYSIEDIEDSGDFLLYRARKKTGHDCTQTSRRVRSGRIRKGRKKKKKKRKKQKRKRKTGKILIGK